MALASGEHGVTWGDEGCVASRESLCCMFDDEVLRHQRPHLATLARTRGTPHYRHHGGGWTCGTTCSDVVSDSQAMAATLNTSRRRTSRRSSVVRAYEAPSAEFGGGGGSLRGAIVQMVQGILRTIINRHVMSSTTRGPLFTHNQIQHDSIPLSKTRGQTLTRLQYYTVPPSTPASSSRRPHDPPYHYIPHEDLHLIYRTGGTAHRANG